jgi:prevent-host-death family protein
MAMKTRRVSVAEAKNKLPALIHEAEANGDPVEITRRGKTVAVLVSSTEYGRHKSRGSVVDEVRQIFERYGNPRGLTRREIASWRERLEPPRQHTFDED